jgi:acetate---CoA ligase (ADP-forming)
VATVKPIVAVKAGRSAAGRRAAGSHTGAMVEGSEELTDALLAQAGVIRVDTVSELLDVAAVLDRAGLPRGPAAGVLTNAGGAGIACADAADASRLALPRLRPATRATLRALRPGAAVGNPVDLLADVSPGDYVTALGAVATDPGIDAVIALHVPPLAGREDRTVEAVGACASELETPVVAVPLAQDVPPAVAEQVAVLATPEDAARALGRIAGHVRRRARPADLATPPTGIDRAAGAAVVAEGLARGAEWLAPDLAQRLAHAYGIPLSAAVLAPSADAVGAAARELGSPVAVKVVAEGLTHKTELGAAEMLRALRCFPLLNGWRGAPRAKLRAVEDVIRRMAALVVDRPEIAEIECNPLIATPAGAVAVDLRVRLGP